MRFVLNIGMHKTGSSSIQGTFADYDVGSKRYLSVGHPNLSGLLSTLFLTTPENHQTHRRNMRGPRDVAQLRDQFHGKVDAFLDGTPSDATVFASAEDLCLFDHEEVERLARWTQTRFDDVTIVGYARPPHSFMSSAMQQRIAGGVPWSARQLFPRYRDRFQPYDDVFGRGRVELVKFAPDALVDADVVIDFADRVGLERGSYAISRANEGRRAGTIAALLSHRVHVGQPSRYPGSPRDNSTLVDLLRALGGERLEIAPEVAAAVASSRLADLDWISERVGDPDFNDIPTVSETPPKPGTLRIADKEDLLARAAAELPAVLRLAADYAVREQDPKLTAMAVDLLLQMIRSNHGRSGGTPASTPKRPV